MTLRRRLALYLGLLTALAVAVAGFTAAVLVGPGTVSEQRLAAGALAVVGAALVLVSAAVGYLVGHRRESAVRLLGDRLRVSAPGRPLAPPARLPPELRELAATIDERLVELAEANRRQRTLVADVGHELSTPLAALRSNLETLRDRGGELTPEQRETLLAAAVAETLELGDVAAGLGDIRPDGGRGERRARISLAHVAEEVAARYRRRSERLIVVIELVGGPLLEADPEQIERAIGNLVDNAVKWGPPDTPVEITVGTGWVEVRDHGPGIPEEDIPFVFDRFYRSGGGAGKPGSGLGLAIVEQVVTLHGGETYARNAPGGGAAVGFRLPSPR